MIRRPVMTVIAKKNHVASFRQKKENLVDKLILNHEEYGSDFLKQVIVAVSEELVEKTDARNLQMQEEKKEVLRISKGIEKEKKKRKLIGKEKKMEKKKKKPCPKKKDAEKRLRAEKKITKNAQKSLSNFKKNKTTMAQRVDKSMGRAARNPSKLNDTDRVILCLKSHPPNKNQSFDALLRKLNLMYQLDRTSALDILTKIQARRGKTLVISRDQKTIKHFFKN